jgi:hypothetical protein
VDAPETAVTEADRLLVLVMGERGYPTEGYEQQVSDLSVEHAATIDRYRKAHDISAQAEAEKASTEDLRQAMVHYRALFTELLETDDEAVTNGHGSDRTAETDTAAGTEPVAATGGTAPTEPATAGSAAAEPAAAEPVAEEPVAEERATGTPEAKEPVAAEPAAAEPVSEPVAPAEGDVAVAGGEAETPAEKGAERTESKTGTRTRTSRRTTRRDSDDKGA